MIKLITVVNHFLGWHSTKKLLEARYRIFSASYFAQGLVFGITGIAFPIYLQRQFNDGRTGVNDDIDAVSMVSATLERV